MRVVAQETNDSIWLSHLGKLTAPPEMIRPATNMAMQQVHADDPEIDSPTPQKEHLLQQQPIPGPQESLEELGRPENEIQ